MPSNNRQRLAELSQIFSLGAIAVNEENHTNHAIQAPAINHSGAACWLATPPIKNTETLEGLDFCHALPLKNK
ncbi:hypothetical protein M2404_002830 [Rheinheimera pacifica]|uniref:hypothetical protein n=1 Tax=Rheinheimera pacifica TaxID=173990 RepID=UPI0021690D65|nr:hypothetical protein [Rheinheimera pacifica]MCS4308473.1 hypothetical protein [Rheinheimera pacifica]